MTSLHVRSTPLKTSAFLPPDGSKIFFSGRRRYFHVWDLSTGAVSKISRIYGHKDEQRTMESFKLSPCGRWMGLIGSARKGGGVINVLDATSCQWIAEVRVEGKNGVAGFDWWGDGEGMVVIGTGGEAVEWDIRGKKVVGRWMDEGAVGTSTIALGGRGSGDTGLGGDRWVAVGSSSGIVNVYDRKTWKLQISGKPKPTRVFDQLTTPTSHLVFSPDGQILAIASRWKKDALRLGKPFILSALFPHDDHPSPFHLPPAHIPILPSPSPIASILCSTKANPTPNKKSPPPLLHRLPQLAHFRNTAGSHHGCGVYPRDWNVSGWKRTGEDKMLGD